MIGACTIALNNRSCLLPCLPRNLLPRLPRNLPRKVTSPTERQKQMRWKYIIGKWKEQQTRGREFILGNGNVDFGFWKFMFFKFLLAKIQQNMIFSWFFFSIFDRSTVVVLCLVNTLIFNFINHVLRPNSRLKLITYQQLKLSTSLNLNTKHHNYTLYYILQLLQLQLQPGLGLGSGPVQIQN
jgi:hypothetical protein